MSSPGFDYGEDPFKHLHIKTGFRNYANFNISLTLSPFEKRTWNYEAYMEVL